jgi:hypothetical protein
VAAKLRLIGSTDSRITQDTLATISNAKAKLKSRVTAFRGSSSSKMMASCRRKATPLFGSTFSTFDGETRKFSGGV